MKKNLLVFVTVLLLAVSGCINYKEEIELNADGSGKLMMHYSLSEQLTAMMQMGKQMGGQKNETKEMPFKLKEEEVKADLQAKGVRFEKFETKTENQEQHFFVTVSFDRITDLNQTKTFREMPFEWKEEGDVIELRRVLKGKEEKKSDTSSAGDAMAKQMAQAMLGNAAFEFQVKLPSRALPSPDTNGTIAEDGVTVYWKYPLVDISEGGDKVMVAKFEKGSTFPILMIGIVAVAAVVSLGALIFVLSIARKR